MTRIKTRFRTAYDHLMERVEVPVLAYLNGEPEGDPPGRDMRRIPIVFEVITNVAAHLIVGVALGRKEQDELIRMFGDALNEAVADLREIMEEVENHEHH